MMSGSLTGSNPLKGWLMGLLGLFVATIGLDPIHAHDRFTFGSDAMAGGIGLIPALVGAFGFAEVLTMMAEPSRTAIADSSRLGAAATRATCRSTGAPSCARA